MKTIMISIRPEWMCRILNGEKPDEIRRGVAIYKAIKKLIKVQGKAILFGYCTKRKPSVAPFHFEEGWFYREYNNKTSYACGCAANMGEDINGKVVARLEVDAEEIYSDIFQCEYRTNSLNQDKILERSKLSAKQLREYLGKGFHGLGTDVHILSKRTFDEPKELKDFGIKAAPQSWCYAEVEE